MGGSTLLMTGYFSARARMFISLILLRIISFCFSRSIGSSINFSGLFVIFSGLFSFFSGLGCFFSGLFSFLM